MKPPLLYPDDAVPVEVVGRYRAGGAFMGAMLVVAFLLIVAGMIYGAATADHDPVCGIDQTAVAGHCEPKDLTP